MERKQSHKKNLDHVALIPKYLPMGQEDKTEVAVGYKVDKKGKHSMVKVNVWREEKIVCYELKNQRFFKLFDPTSSDSDLVDMKNPWRAGECKVITLAHAQTLWAHINGDYLRWVHVSNFLSVTSLLHAFLFFVCVTQ